MTPLISVKPKITEKITALLDLESIDQSQSVKKISKLVGENYDHFYFRSNHGSAYVDELKSCATMAKVVKAWPRAYFDPVSVCVPNEETHEKDCQDASYLMLRAQYAAVFAISAHLRARNVASK